MERVNVHMKCMFSMKALAFGHVWRNRNCSLALELDTVWFPWAALYTFFVAGEGSQTHQHISAMYLHMIRLHLYGLQYEPQVFLLLPGRMLAPRVTRATYSYLVAATELWHTIFAMILCFLI